MKYAIIFILILIISLIILLLYFKKNSKNKDFKMPNVKIKMPTYIETFNDNHNPSFLVELIDYKKGQLGISKSTIGEKVTFKLENNKRITVKSINKQYLGQIAIKDYKNFSLIASKPNYFEGEIYSFNKESLGIKKVIISVQAKEEFSKQIYHTNKNYLNTLITLKALFSEEQIIETNYGPATIKKIYEDHLLVEVPSLGNREIYDIENLI